MIIKPLRDIRVTSPYGWRIHPITRRRQWHTGVDLSAAVGTPCLAVADGTVKVSKTNRGGVKCGLGHYLVIEHDGFCTVYAHLNALGLRAGTKVRKGQIVAYTGNTGASAGAHLHFEVRKGQYRSDFWRRDKDGNYINAVDPSAFEPINKDIPDWAKDGYNFVVENGLSDGSRPHDQVTRMELWTTLQRFYKLINK